MFFFSLYLEKLIKLIKLKKGKTWADKSVLPEAGYITGGAQDRSRETLPCLIIIVDLSVTYTAIVYLFQENLYLLSLNQKFI